MTDTKQFVQRLKFVKGKDIISVFPMLLGFICSLPFRLIHKNIWLICERKDEARDNGYWFFKYMVENHPEIESVYAINKKSTDYSRVKNLGKIIQFGSLTHWIYYFSAKKNISSQKQGKPNPAICFILEVYLGFRKNRVYLKHGIIKDAQRWIYFDVSKINLLCCASYNEYNYVKNHFGYPSKSIALTGLCRYDNLNKPHIVKKQILVMPTMREWLRTISSDTLLYEKSSDFCNSDYFITWKHFIDSEELSNLLDLNDIHLVFYLHPSMQKYINYFEIEKKRIKIASAKNYDIQELLMESALLVTDYSSVYFDFAYMLKPVVYYQFDYEKYRKGQYQEGYFSYERNGFGPVVFDETSLVKEIKNKLANNFEMENLYKRRALSFFAFHDSNNCKRTYSEIIKMDCSTAIK